MRAKVPKCKEIVLIFQDSYQRARQNMIVIPIVLGFLFYCVWSLFYSHIPKDQTPLSIVLLLGGALSWFFVKGLFSFLGGKARCPQCKSPPLVFSKFLGIGPIISMGIPLFECQISRCHKCDYPLSIAELEKDLAAESVDEKKAISHA